MLQLEEPVGVVEGLLLVDGLERGELGRHERSLVSRRDSGKVAGCTHLASLPLTKEITESSPAVLLQLDPLNS
jgi:hypothetical protein